MTADATDVCGAASSGNDRHKAHVRPGHCQDVAWMLPLWRRMMAEHEAFHPAFALAEDAAHIWQRGIWDLMARQDSFVFVAPQAGFCCGWLARHPAIYASCQVGLLSEICVAQSKRKSGIGTALMASAKTWFLRRDVREFQLATAMSNKRAQAFFSSHGGSPVLLRYHFALTDDLE